jgi:hypothetical protein
MIKLLIEAIRKFLSSLIAEGWEDDEYFYYGKPEKGK